MNEQHGGQTLLNQAATIAGIAGHGEMADRTRRFDWANTPLGPIESWPDSLMNPVNTLLTCPHPMFLWWGPELIQFYNDAYRVSLGEGKHPKALGQRGKECWPEIWHIIGPQIAAVMAGGTPTFERNSLVPIYRNGGLEDVYWTYSYSPLFGKNGAIQGTLVVCMETTESVFAEQRLRQERERFRELFLQAPLPIVMMSGPEHRFTLANPLYIRLMRRTSPESVLGKPVREALPELEGQNFFELLDDVYRTGEPFIGHEIKGTLQREDSGKLDDAYFDFVYQPMRNAEGNVEGIMVVAVEVTDRVRARQVIEGRQQLLENLQRETARQWAELETIYRTAAVGLALFDPVEFRVLRLNDKQAEILGLPATQAVGMTATEVAANFPGLRRMIQEVADGKPATQQVLEGELHASPGMHRYWHVDCHPVYAPDGAVRAITTATTDITMVKQAEAALLQSEKLAVVGRLASSIAHEINNPLESVTNLLYLARASEEFAQIQDYLELAEQELRRVSVIASQTLRFYRQSTSPQAVTCEELIDGVLLTSHARLLNAGVRVEKRKRARKSVICSEGEIRQVLNNLVGNAIDAMRPGGRLLIRSRDATDWKTGKKGLVITVADTGSGMNAQTRKRIFEPFFTTKGIGGTGLGLWISSEIVTRHQGWLRVRSRKGEDRSGTVFSVFLPHFDDLH
ncbi:MAG: PAS domain-containing protein [Acidobacteriaceae bacterium]